MIVVPHSPQLSSIITVTLVLHFFIFIKALKQLAREIGRWGAGDITSLVKNSVFASVEVAVVSTTSYILFAMGRGQFSQRQGSDWMLLMCGILIPLANLGFFFTPLEGFDVEKKNWPAFQAIMMALGAGMGDLPLAHLLLQWLLSAPAFM